MTPDPHHDTDRAPMHRPEAAEPAITHQRAAVRREVRVGTRTEDAVEATSVLSQTYATSVADLWQACTDPVRLARWLAPVTGDLRLGGRYQMEGNASGEVLACDPPHGFTLSWVYAERASELRVSIAPEGGGATLTLEHTGGESIDFWDTYGPGATGVGWDLGLLGLATHLRTGGGKPDDEEAWTRSPEAAAFIADCSRAWGDAAVDAGLAEDWVRAAQDRTTAFFTGTEPSSA